MSESKKRKGRERRKKLAFTLVPGTVTYVISLNLQRHPGRWLFLSSSSSFFPHRQGNERSERLKNQSKAPQLVSDRVTSLGLSLPPRIPSEACESHHAPRRQRATMNTEAAPEHSQALAAAHPSINVFFNNEVFSAS